MGVPDYLLVHKQTPRIRPFVGTDDYNNAVYTYDPEEGAVVKNIDMWLQQDQRTQMSQENIARQGRYPEEERWLLISNDDDIRWQDRVLFDGNVFEVYAEPEKTYTPAGYHHLEATLRIVKG